MLDAPREIATNRLTLRPPVEADRPLWVRIARDASLGTDAPDEMPTTEDRAEADFDATIERWGSGGFDRSVVVESANGHGVGVGGIRSLSTGDRLGLTFRLDGAVHGRGLAREAGRAWCAHALEWLPRQPLVCRVLDRSPAAMRTALSVGMEVAGTEPGPDGSPGSARTLFAAPRVESLRQLDDATRASVLDLWCAVNDTGGAVGFLEGAPRSFVARALAAHEEQMAAGLATAVLLRSPTDEVVGLGLWVADANPLFVHGRRGYRIMTDPTRRGRNLGRLLLSAMHRVAREDDVEIAVVVVRSGLGLTRFYEQAGYVEVGRLPATIRVAPGDDRDSIYLARRLDGRPIVADGRA